MKLIDKEALLMALRKKRYSKQSLDLIESQPVVVKAIPIEWIEKYTDHRLVKHGDTWTFINCMINDWEKENAKAD